MNVQGKAAIITGGGTGVGRAAALGFARLGCSVLVNYSRSRQDAEATAVEIEKLGVRALAFEADVSDDAACRKMVDAALAAFGRLDVLVNSAGTTRFIPHAALDLVLDDDWERIFAVNVKGPFQCIRAARAPMLAVGGGAVVNVTSIAGISATGSSIPYAASKAALINMTVSLARALAPAIRVNSVAPGFIAGRWLEQGLGPHYEAIKTKVEQGTPTGRVCTPEDVGQTIVGLITGSDQITGQTIVCDGGMLIAEPVRR